VGGRASDRARARDRKRVQSTEYRVQSTEYRVQGCDVLFDGVGLFPELRTLNSVLLTIFSLLSIGLFSS